MLLLTLLLALFTAPPLDDGGSRAGDVRPADDYETALTALLQEVVTPEGLVRYDRLRGDLSLPFRRVLKAVEDYDPARLATPAQRLAFWLNAYNVQMLQNIVETPGARDIMAGGHADRFFKTPYRTARMAVTLDAIEHVALRGQDGPAALQALGVPTVDPRIHVGLNCAAVSCPRLRRRAFTAATVNAQLDAALRDFTADPAHLRVEDGRVVLSSLLDWFGPDFDRPTGKAGDYLLRFMPAGRPDYATLRRTLAGRNAAALKALPQVRYAYAWEVNRAP